jgi:hypothetical protein
MTKKKEICVAEHHLELDQEYFYSGLMFFFLLILVAVGFIIYRHIHLLGAILIIFPIGFWVGYLCGKDMRGG